MNVQVNTYLNSKSWETRIAAGQAVEAIASNVKQWEPKSHPKQELSPDAEWDEQDNPKEREPLSFDSFDFNKVRQSRPFITAIHIITNFLIFLVQSLLSRALIIYCIHKNIKQER